MSKMRDLLRKNVRSLREGLDLTQDQLAERSKLSIKMIQKVEYGKTAPSPETLDKICKALNAKPADLFKDTDLDRGVKFMAVHAPRAAYEAKKQAIRGQSFSAAAEFLALFENLPPERKALVSMFVYNDRSYLSDNPDLAHAAAILLKGLKPAK